MELVKISEKITPVPGTNKVFGIIEYGLAKKVEPGVKEVKQENKFQFIIYDDEIAKGEKHE